MSLTSWINEFYPVQAEDCPTDNVAMLEHAILKWRGALPENLKKHNMVFVGPVTIEEYEPTKQGSAEASGGGPTEEPDPAGGSFYYNTQSCALCGEYRKDVVPEEDEDVDLIEPDCEGCPLYDLQGYSCCYAPKDPYYEFMETGNPKPMINALIQCLQIEQKNWYMYQKEQSNAFTKSK